MKRALRHLFAACLLPALACAQVPPSSTELAAYRGLHRAAAAGDVSALRDMLATGAAVDARDGRGRTPLLVAVHRGQHAAMRTLVAAGADANALDHDAYDIVTIAAVADDLPTLRQALALGGRADNVTSPWRGTALIAAAHLGHAQVVQLLVDHGAPLEHVNTLGWTALIEAIVLGDGGARHVDTLRRLLMAGADANRPDGQGQRPLALAEGRGYVAMATLLRAAGAR